MVTWRQCLWLPRDSVYGYLETVFMVNLETVFMVTWRQCLWLPSRQCLWLPVDSVYGYLEPVFMVTCRQCLCSLV